MKTLWSTRKKAKDESFDELEYYLRSVLRPVEPKPDFVSELGARLVGATFKEDQWPVRLQYALLAVAGLISSVIIVVTGIRATLTLLGAMGFMRHIKNQVQSNQTTAIPPIA
jgi:hypothetical protein